MGGGNGIPACVISNNRWITKTHGPSICAEAGIVLDFKPDLAESVVSGAVLLHEERAEVAASLRESGLSLRAIAAATGEGYGTVRRELSREPNGSPEPADAIDAEPAESESATAQCIHCCCPAPRRGCRSELPPS